MSMVYFCHDERRRDIIAGRADLNGIDFLEVLDSPALPLNDRQRTLFVHFINDPAALALSAKNVKITGGERIRNIQVIKAEIKVDARSGSTGSVLVVEVDQRGDHSIYTLWLVEDPAAPGALNNIDPVLRNVDFSFKVNCPSTFDCQQPIACPIEPRSEPVIDYLARDFNSLRQVMLDRLAVLVPDWKERHTADLGVAMVELLAYVGDHLSYRQDAVATEAYLSTARRRISARRHARLVDYFMHDGCNARAWLHVQIDENVPDVVVLPAGTQVLTATVGQPDIIAPASPSYNTALSAGAEVFETMHEASLRAEHNEMRFYTWGAQECCLPKGAVKATLRGAFPNLQSGNVLIFKEVLSPRSGDPDDAAFDHRQAVKLVRVDVRVDPIGGQFDDPPSTDPLEVTDIEWAEEDRLQFALCISSEKDEGGGFVNDVSVALGNIVLADHGQSLPDEELMDVPAALISRLPAQIPGEMSQGEDSCGCDTENRLQLVPIRYHPALKEGPVTQAVPFTSLEHIASAAAATSSDPSEAVPEVELSSTSQSTGFIVPWQVRRDLLSSTTSSREFVVEVENDGKTYLRFPKERHEAAVTADMKFTASYRVGNGLRGNVGAETLVHLVTTDSRMIAVTNPLPARGGVDAEPIERVRRRAPFAFREDQLRAVTPADYAALAREYAGVQRAAATFRWTGSWHTAFVSVDRLGGTEIVPNFETNLRNHLDVFRMAGVDLEIEPPRLVPLEIVLKIYVKPEYFQSDVHAALLQVFTSQSLPDGRRGIFHPDNFTFGQSVHLSPIVAAAQGVDGVAAVETITFQRKDAPDPEAKDQGFILFGRLEIAALDNNPNFPERGTFELQMEGGK